MAMEYITENPTSNEKISTYVVYIYMRNSKYNKFISLTTVSSSVVDLLFI